jgi:hypothetical protein
MGWKITCVAINNENKNGNQKYSYLVISYQNAYFVKYLSEVEMKKKLEFLVDKIWAVVGG